METLKEPVQQLVNTPAAGFALTAGIAGASWSASGYLLAFGRALNRMYEVEEGRPVWKLRSTILLIDDAAYYCDGIGIDIDRLCGSDVGSQRSCRTSDRRGERGG